MKVFNTCFKIVKKQAPQLSIYIVIFLALAILFSATGSTNKIGDFVQSKTRVGIINHDEDSVLINGLKDYLGRYSEFVTVPDDTEKIQDALFYRDMEYLITIPKGFTNDFLNGRDVTIGKTEVAGSTSGIYTGILVNKYLSTARLYINSSAKTDQKVLIRDIAKDLQYDTKVDMKKTSSGDSNNNPVRFYYNYLSYILICILLYGVSSIMMVFNDTNIKRRNLCAPIKNISINLQILFGNLAFSVFCWGLITVCGFILYRGKMATVGSAYMILNSFVFMITALSISFFVGLMIKGRNAQAAAANILSLGLSFISGAFVPQELLSKGVLAIANFTPTYWYIKANNAIEGLTKFSLNNLMPIFRYMLIELGFAVAIVSVALVISKRKQLRGN
ncbi:MAG TPA: ABC transporter permease [Ruminiclostridium sp.]|nr:ABC transporter permease [Ruminiclostridium sp.]